jgi:hypothetical protein
MTADWVYVVAGGSLLLAIVLPELLSRWAVSTPMVLLALGMLIGATPLPEGMPLDPRTTGWSSSTSPSWRSSSR